MKIRKLVRRLFRARKKRPIPVAPAEYEKPKANPDESPAKPITITSVEDFWGYRNR